MVDEPDPERLRALEARLHKVTKAARTERQATGNGFSQGEVAWRMIIELVTGMLIGLALGYGLDVLFGTLPICLMIFTLLGFAAGVKTMLRTAKQLNRDASEKSGPDEGK
ncbi:MAG: F0F1 ATP synthase subunit I [Cereibacter sphaeroides]|uniref:ATP synthase protein I n=1 Tax=Cereibacter sphaeroides TaxID=1063 RepID=A0A2W5S112_CERSP|nr:MAG: F0F1 ATP synthase subunit I [Cereibacter sphaeroides]